MILYDTQHDNKTACVYIYIYMCVCELCELYVCTVYYL